MRVHLLASERHYARHARAVWKHLPDEVRGHERVGRVATDRSLPREDFIMVGGVADIDRAQRNRIIYVEHGAGQSYLGDPTSRHAMFYPHPNSTHPQRVLRYISPREAVAEAWGRPAFAAGCPALDDLTPSLTSNRAAITFHHDAFRVCPEARSAAAHWEPVLHELVLALQTDGFEVIGHGHPRDREAQLRWERLDVPFERDPDVILETCSLLVADNTSLMYEAAALNIAVVALNAPWYRKDVDHGLRFWDAVPGQSFDDIDDIISFDFRSYVHEDPWYEGRLHAALAAYDRLPDGKAGPRAAQWLLDSFGK